MFELNVRFQIAALIFVAVILFDFLRSKKIPTAANKKFRMVIICTVISLLCDITTVYTITHMDTVSAAVNIAAHKALYISIAAVVQSFYKYICSLDSDRGTENRLASALCNLPFAAAIVCALLLNVYFVCDNEKYAYSQGAAVVGMFFFVGILLLIIINTTIRIRIPAENKIMILCGVMVWIIVCIIQYFVPSLLLTGLGISVMLLLVYLAFENPAEYTDHQTGCYNAYAFESVLKEKIHSGKAFDIITVAVDELDAVIMRFGYDESHRLMREIAEFLTSLSGKNVYIYRDDCLALFSDNDEAADSLCRAIQKRLGGTWTLQGMSAAVRTHADLLRFPDYAHNSAEVNSIIKYADEHTADGNLLNIIDQKCVDGFKRETELAALLKNAVRNDGIGAFKIYYMPVYNAERKAYTSAEAFIHLSGTDGFDTITPDEFIPIAEKNGLIADINGIAIKKIRRFISENKISALGIEYVEINLPNVRPVSCLSDESKAVNIHRIKSRAEGLDAEIMGKVVSCLSVISESGSDIIKLDRELVLQCFGENDETGKIILEGLIGTVRRLNIKAVAEGADTEKTARKLISLGITYLQGDYYSAPLGEDEFLRFMKEACAKGM